jgi:hypothetical protein
MKLKLALLTAALAFGLGVPAALAQEAPAAPDQGAAEQSAPPSQDESGAAPQEAPPADESAPQ